MRIRSITSFYDPLAPDAEEALQKLAGLSARLARKISTDLVPVQSTRLATSPFPRFLKGLHTDDAIDRVVKLEASTCHLGWQYLSLGPALPGAKGACDLIPLLLAETRDVFFSTIIADKEYLYTDMVRKSAEIIQAAAYLEPDGFANLRFAALARVKPFTPFLPAAYARVGSPPVITFAVECADAVIDAFKGASDLDTARRDLLNRLEEFTRQIMDIYRLLAQGTGIECKGFDLSPAPFPEDWCSLGGALETLGLEHIGGIGSLAPVAFIADTLDQGNWLRVGFNGMMLPLLEDSVLARRAGQGLLSVHDLLLYSTVCGTGLDTIPLAGNTTAAQLECVLMDIGCLALRLAKPLTARLMPIPGKQAGDATGFDFSFFANSRVLALDGQQLAPPLLSNTPLKIAPRQRG